MIHTGGLSSFFGHVLPAPYYCPRRDCQSAIYKRFARNDRTNHLWNCWTGALAHLGVARANALQSKTFHGQGQGADADAARVRAIAAYKDFLTLWKDADPDVPILKQAKAEYAKLQ